MGNLVSSLTPALAPVTGILGGTGPLGGVGNGIGGINNPGNNVGTGDPFNSPSNVCLPRGRICVLDEYTTENSGPSCCKGMTCVDLTTFIGGRLGVCLEDEDGDDDDNDDDDDGDETFSSAVESVTGKFPGTTGSSGLLSSISYGGTRTGKPTKTRSSQFVSVQTTLYTSVLPTTYGPIPYTSPLTTPFEPFPETSLLTAPSQLVAETSLLPTTFETVLYTSLLTTPSATFPYTSLLPTPSGSIVSTERQH